MATKEMKWGNKKCSDECAHCGDETGVFATEHGHGRVFHYCKNCKKISMSELKRQTFKWIKI